MQHIDIVLNNSVPRLAVEHVRLGERVATREPEQPRPSDDRKLPDGVEHGVSSQNTERASVIFAGGECVRVDHQESQLRLRRRGVDPLSASDTCRVDFRSEGQRVVHYGDESEARR